MRARAHVSAYLIASDLASDPFPHSLSRTRLCVHTYTRVHTHTHTRMYAYTHLQMSLLCGLEPSTDTIYRYMYVELM